MEKLPDNLNLLYWICHSKPIYFFLSERIDHLKRHFLDYSEGNIVHKNQFMKIAHFDKSISQNSPS